jgi:hypothetical protein
MRRMILVTCAVAAVAAGSFESSPGAAPQAPRQTSASEQATGRQAQGKPEQAKPRPPTTPPRRAVPPPRVLPPAYHAPPHRYYFPPVSSQRGFYYHPYFGFYFGPYYGPFYPYPGPSVTVMRHSAAAIRTRVTPRDTEVYVNGYYAGIVDDFDGVFQRLYLPAGEHDLEFRLEGYQTYRQAFYVGPGDSREIVHTMRKLRAGETGVPPLPPRAADEGWIGAGTGGDRPASPFGVLVLRVQPADALIVVDEEVWVATEDRAEMVIHISSGTHRLEVRKPGYQSFVTDIALSEGATTRLAVTLVR